MIFGIVDAVIVLCVIVGYVLFAMPKDLGVGYTKADLDSVNGKLGIQYNTLAKGGSPADSLNLSGKKEIKTEFTQQELTALMAQHEDNWKYYPVRNTQIKFNRDGTIEVSGKLEAGKFEEYADATNMPEKYRNFIGEYVGMVPIAPAFYVKTQVGVENGEASGDVKEAKIGAFNLPPEWFDNNNDFATGMVEDRIQKAGLDIKSASFENGRLNFDGSIPEVVGMEG
jgi:hypothetical protein